MVVPAQSRNALGSNPVDDLPADYRTTIVISRMVAVLGGIILLVSVFVALAGFGKFAGASKGGFGSAQEAVEGSFMMAAGIAGAVMGALCVLWGQTTRAIVENANYSRQMLELLKKELGDFEEGGDATAAAASAAGVSQEAASSSPAAPPSG